MNTVTGGTFIETASDSHCLYDRHLMREQYNFLDLMFDWKDLSKRVDEGWRNAGIISVTRPFTNNEYHMDGKLISRKEAYHIIGY